MSLYTRVFFNAQVFRTRVEDLVFDGCRTAGEDRSPQRALGESLPSLFTLFARAPFREKVW